GRRKNSVTFYLRKSSKLRTPKPPATSSVLHALRAFPGPWDSGRPISLAPSLILHRARLDASLDLETFATRDEREIAGCATVMWTLFNLAGAPPARSGGKL